ncbi:MAG: lamin tail domain-containing protein, partial [bacterium]|nr:lamin tail domain-containing protein [bacterium]
MRVKRELSVLLAIALIFMPLVSFAQVIPTDEVVDNPITLVLPNLLITELQPNGLAAEQEFIEIYNASDLAINLSQIKLERATSTSTTESSWQNLVTLTPLSGELLANTYLVIAHRDYAGLNADYRYSSNLSNSGGHIRIVWNDPTTEIIEKYELDKLGWGTAAMPELLPTAAAAPGRSLQRCILETDDYDDSNNNSLDFKEFSESTPGAESLDCTPEVVQLPPSEDNSTGTTDQPAEDDEDSDEEAQPPEPAPLADTFLPIVITELMPNPASPLTDAADEYVELYNPNDVDIELDGWKLETGSSFSYRVFLNDKVIPAKGYLVIKSVDTNLTLSNTSGAARLVNPNGETESIADTYSDAGDGEAWALIAGVWQWTSSPTEGIPNILVAAPVTAVKSAVKKATAKKAATKKKKATTAKTTTKKPKAETATRSIFEEPPTDGKLLPVNPAVLAVVG